MPSFNATVTLPLVDSSLSLGNILQDGGSVQIDKSTGNYSLVNTFDFPALRLGDSLNIQAINVNYSTTLNANPDLRARLSSFSDVAIRLSELDPNCQGSGSGVVAAVDRVVRIPVQLSNGLQRIQFQSGALLMNMQNNLPIDVELGSLPGSSTSAVMLSTPGQPDIKCTIDPTKKRLGRAGTSQSKMQLRLPLDGAVIDRNTTLVLRTSTVGSQGQTVSYSPSSTFSVQLSGDNLKINDAAASLAAMPLRFDFDAALPAGTNISDGVIREFVANLQIRNDFALKGNATLVFPQLTNQQSHAPLSINVAIPARSTKSIQLSNNGQNYVIAPDATDKAHGGMVSALHCQCILQTEELPTVEDFNESQTLQISGLISPIAFSNVSGYNSNASDVKFTFGSALDELSASGFSVQNSDIREVQVHCDLNNSTANAGTLSGNVSLLDSKGAVLLVRPIEPTFVKAQAKTSADFAFNELHLAGLPTRVVIDGTLHSAAGSFVLSSNGSLTGQVSLRIPLRIRVEGGTYTSSSVFSIDGSLRDRVQSAELLMEAHNKIPATVGVHLDFFDQSNVLIERVPRSGEIAVQAFANKAQSATTVQRLSLDSSACARVMSSSRYRTVVSFATDSPDYVSFRSADSLALRLQLQCTTLIH